MKLGKALGKPVFSTTKPSKALIIPEAKVGVEIEFENWDGTNGTSLWDDVEDHSLRNNGREFITRGGMVGQQLIDAIEEFCALAKAKGWSEGTPRAAIHIHIDCTDLDLAKGELATLVSLYSIVEHMLFSYAGEWRRGCGFCDALEDSEADLESLGKAMYDSKGAQLHRIVAGNYLSKYQALNLMALSKYGTVEFRILPTTFDSKRIITWINMLLQLKQAALDFNTAMPVLAQFSREGARGFAQKVMGDMWPEVESFFREDRAWAAIDTAIALLSYGQQLKLLSEIPEASLWNEGVNQPVGWVKDKVAKLVSSTPTAAPPKTTTIRRLAEAGVPVAPPRTNEELLAMLAAPVAPRRRA